MGFVDGATGTNNMSYGIIMYYSTIAISIQLYLMVAFDGRIVVLYSDCNQQQEQRTQEGI